MSISLERGQRRRAEEVLGSAFDALTRSHDADRMPLVVGQMASEYLLSTGDWKRMDELLAPLKTVEASIANSSTRVNTPGCPCHVKIAAKRGELEAQALLAFTHGEAAAAERDVDRIAASKQAFLAATSKMEKEAADDWKTSGLILDADLAEMRGKPQDAIGSLRQAIASDEREPPSGPAGAVTARERLGELLLRQHRAAEALKEFRQSLDTHPRRSRSLLDAARAASVVDAAAARDYYSQLAANWSQADADTPGFAELRTSAQSRR
jgi:tetratricopeptide (TPR) repeat protein